VFPFSSPAKKVRQQAREWVSLARKVDNYRRDVMPQADLEELRLRRRELEAVLHDKQADSKAFEQPVHALEKVLRRVGGSFYPRSFWVENIEMILVAAILAIGVRTFFLQPFKIPTNSMYPTYNGLTAETYFHDDIPNRAMQLFNLLRLGATQRTVGGEPGAELVLPIQTLETLRTHRVAGPRGGFSGPYGGAYLAQQNVAGRQWLFFPSTKAMYSFIVGDKVVDVRVPMDFPMGDVIAEIVERAGGDFRVVPGSGEFDYLAHTGIRADEAGNLLGFSVKTGDMLMVDRFTYNFRRPEAGDPFVFRTDNIVGMNPGERGKYYIKRIAGVPGDTLQIDPPALLRNGEPATAARAFVRNAAQEGEYPGYKIAPRGTYFPGNTPLKLPEESYIALGDNSPHSLDSRMWGFVPEDAIVGKAVFIYYPFSFRWGLAE